MAGGLPVEAETMNESQREKVHYYRELLRKHQEWKVLIATPTSGGVSASMAVQLFYLLRRPVVCDWVVERSALLPDARNELVRTFLPGSYSNTLFVDSDVALDVLPLARLLKRNLDVVTGIYKIKTY
jgi:hypothetical protein